ncbi:MAG TPA: helix-turn-helix domain-containing protein [Solirubrobacterales bacterium]|nr:helix-turn-helix domain-containing protein [Solirubrobacterales bacterium]
MRSYDEYCAVAKSLDLVGDRWTLLVVRELSQRGAARYTDLRNGLPGIASNLLADRLRDLEAAGLVTREEAPPPVATTLFRLTPRGEGLRPVLDELMRWGLPLMVEQKPEDAVRSHWLAGAVEVMVSDRDPGGDPVTLELRIADEPVVIAAAGGETKVTLGAASDPDAALVGPERPILGLLFGVLDRPGAEAMGVTLEGDPKVIDRFAAEPAAAA